MKIGLICNHNAYVAREYLHAVRLNDIRVEVIAVGQYPNVDEPEEERCGGLWHPPLFDAAIQPFPYYHFPSLKSPELFTFLSNAGFDLGIQGGTGILKQAHIEAFRLGILNFHPGDLPQYRGCSAPEWQIYEGKPVIATCHLVSEGIDAGPVVAKRTLNVDMTSYERMRASVYPLMSGFMVDVVKEIITLGGFTCAPEPQNETFAQYRDYIGADRIEHLKQLLQARGALPQPA